MYHSEDTHSKERRTMANQKRASKAEAIVEVSLVWDHVTTLFGSLRAAAAGPDDGADGKVHE